MNQFVTAAAMARAVATDPDITLPVRPKLCEGLCLLPVRGGLLIDGAAERQFLSGRGASDLLPRLLPALDGEQDVAGIAARIGAPLAHVQAAVALLYTRGVIEEGGGPPAENAADIFLSRASDSTAVNANGAEARARLERATVIIVGEDRFAERLLDLIGKSGVGQCSLISPARIGQALEPLSARSAAHRVVVLLDDRVAPDLDAAPRRPVRLHEAPASSVSIGHLPCRRRGCPHNKSSLLLSFKKEDSSFLKKRSKRLFIFSDCRLGHNSRA